MMKRNDNKLKHTVLTFAKHGENIATPYSKLVGNLKAPNMLKFVKLANIYTITETSNICI